MLSAHWPDPHVAEHRKAWITKKLDGFNRWFDRLGERYHDVLAWALDHRAAMVTMATLTFFASFVLPSRGLSGLAGAIVGIAIMVFAFTKGGLHWSLRTLAALIGFAGQDLLV